LFDECGRVIGVNVAHIQGAADIYYAIRINELLPALQSHGIDAEIDNSACAIRAPASMASQVMQFGSLLVAVGALGVAFTRRGRRYVSQKYTQVKTRYSRSDDAHRERTPPAPPPPPVVARRPVLRGISGYYAGTTLELSDRPWILGRDARASNLVFPPEVDGISKRHCSVRYEVARGTFLLEDIWSTNGTFLHDGRQLAPGQPEVLSTGQRFYLGDAGTMFEVGLESG
jgi:hypothetical protein